MQEYKRTDRFSSELHKELAEVLREEVKDPRLGLVTIQEVRVSRDLSHARIFFTCLGGNAEETEDLLNQRMAGFLRHELARRVRSRTMPRLCFSYDESVEQGAQLSALIEQAVEEDGSR